MSGHCNFQAKFCATVFRKLTTKWRRDSRNQDTLSSAFEFYPFLYVALNSCPVADTHYGGLQKKMVATGKTDVSSCDEPLFVLKYRRFIRGGLIALFSFWVLFASTMILADPDPHFHDVAAVALLTYFTLMQLVELLLFKEFRLYRDRIVKVWRLIGSRELALANARLEIFSIFSLSGKHFFVQESNPCRRLLQWFSFKRVFYLDYFAYPQDAQELTRHLAYVSGRKIEEFERFRILMPKLIKEEANNA
jgi:hypothetical protein